MNSRSREAFSCLITSWGSLIDLQSVPSILSQTKPLTSSLCPLIFLKISSIEFKALCDYLLPWLNKVANCFSSFLCKRLMFIMLIKVLQLFSYSSASSNCQSRLLRFQSPKAQLIVLIKVSKLSGKEGLTFSSISESLTKISLVLKSVASRYIQVSSLYIICSRLSAD